MVKCCQGMSGMSVDTCRDCRDCRGLLGTVRAQLSGCRTGAQLSSARDRERLGSQIKNTELCYISSKSIRYGLYALIQLWV